MTSLPSCCITSPRNPFFVRLKRILKGRGVKKFRQSLVFGNKIVRETLEKHRQYVTDVVVPEGFACDLPVSTGLRVIELSKPLFREVDLFKTNAPFLVVTKPDLPFWSGRFPSGCTLFVPFQDPENVGAVIRSAVAFGVHEIVLLREAADPFHPKSIRSSAGSVFAAPLYLGPSVKDLEDTSENSPTSIFILHMEGVDVRQFRFPTEPFGLLPGLEGPGIKPFGHHCCCLKIPMVGPVESLNASVAVAIALYEWSRQVMPQRE